MLEDIRDKAQRIVLNEEAVKQEFIRHNTELADSTVKAAKKELKAKQKRLEELPKLMQIAYEDRVKGKMPEDICISFLEKYSAEQKALTAEVAELEEKISQTETATQNVDEFIRKIKKYLEVPELTREMCYELIDRIIISGSQAVTGKEREIDIVYKVDIASVLRHKFKK